MAHQRDDVERTRPVARKRPAETREHRDPLTNEQGAHALGTGVGAAGGAATGAVLGSAIAGPVGTIVGGALGAVGGGIAGRSAAETLNPSEEDAYWREAYDSRPYADETLGYDHYRPAYRYGWESRARYPDLRWDQVERDLESGWREHRGTSRLGWTDAKLAARDAWQRVDRRFLDEREIVRQRDLELDADPAGH